MWHWRNWRGLVLLPPSLLALGQNARPRLPAHHRLARARPIWRDLLKSSVNDEVVTLIRHFAVSGRSGECLNPRCGDAADGRPQPGDSASKAQTRTSHRKTTGAA